VRDAGLPGRGEPAAIVVVRDAAGTLRDLSWAPVSDAEVTPVAADTDEGRSVIRHSAAHVLAQAWQDDPAQPIASLSAHFSLDDNPDLS
jgi:threonyl-tRNA synthetase